MKLLLKTLTVKRIKNAYLNKTRELMESGKKFAPIPFDQEVFEAVKACAAHCKKVVDK